MSARRGRRKREGEAEGREAGDVHDLRSVRGPVAMLEWTAAGGARWGLSGSEWVAIVGILGTLGGTLAGYALSWWVERRRWEREDRHRFTQERRELYGRFGSEIMRLLADPDATERDTVRISPLSDSEAQRMWAQKARYESSILSLEAQVLMIAGTPAVHYAASACAREAVDLLRIGPHDSRNLCASWPLERAKGAFVNAVRAELGLQSFVFPDRSGETG